MKLHPIFSDYVISEEGNVYNFRTQRKLKPQSNGKGYLIVGLRKDKKQYTKSIHRLVLQTYDPIENSHLYDAHHENEIRSDNRLENLKWELKAEHLREHKQNMSEETRRRMSEAHKGHLVSEETKRKMSEAAKKNGSIPPPQKGMLFWNDGTKTIRSKECPGEGWVRGRM